MDRNDSTAESKEERERQLARARKQRFDARMRNADASEAKERRHATVIYLSEDARRVLKRNRQRRSALDLPPVLDSTLIGELLLAHDKKTKSVLDAVLVSTQDLIPQGNISKLIGENLSLKKIIKKLEHDRFADKSTIENLEIELESETPTTDWVEIERKLVEAHRLYLSVLGSDFIQSVSTALGEDSSKQRALKVLDEEFTDYIRKLVDKLA